MSIDITTLSVPELDQLIREAASRIEIVKRQQRAQLLRSLEAQARDAGFDVHELFSPDRSQSAKRAVAATYANPKNPEQTWAGIGKRPDWIRAAINAGETLESMRVP